MSLVTDKCLVTHISMGRHLTRSTDFVTISFRVVVHSVVGYHHQPFVTVVSAVIETCKHALCALRTGKVNTRSRKTEEADIDP